MSDYMQDIDLVVKAFIDNDIEIDEDGRCFIVTFVYTSEEDEPVEARIDFDGVIESLVEYYSDLQGYQKLYVIAHELSRHADRLRDCASRFENSDDVVHDLFGIDD
jgi:hypothetical protein